MLIEIVKYPDGSHYAKCDLSIHNEYFRNKYPLTIRINTYDDLWKLNQVVDALNSENITPKVIIPCLLDAQADRRFNKRESFNLKLIIKFLNSMDATFHIYHPHNPDALLFGSDKINILDNYSFISNILSDYKKNNNIDNLCLLSPDAGAYKSVMKLAEKLQFNGNVYSASKSRTYVNGQSLLTQNINIKDFEGKDILIVDDICVYGNTFKTLAKLLRTKNCGKLYLAISHLTIQNIPKEDSILEYFDMVYTTNSKFDYYLCTSNNLKHLNKLKVIQLFNITPIC